MTSTTRADMTTLERRTMGRQQRDDNGMTTMGRQRDNNVFGWVRPGLGEQHGMDEKREGLGTTTRPEQGWVRKGGRWEAGAREDTDYPDD